MRVIYTLQLHSSNNKKNSLNAKESSIYPILKCQIGEHPVNLFEIHRQTSNISRTLVGNKIVDQSNVVGVLPVGAAPGFNGLGEDKQKARKETFQFWNLVRLISEICQ